MSISNKPGVWPDRSPARAWGRPACAGHHEGVLTECVVIMTLPVTSLMTSDDPHKEAWVESSIKWMNAGTSRLSR